MWTKHMWGAACYRTLSDTHARYLSSSLAPCMHAGFIYTASECPEGPEQDSCSGTYMENTGPPADETSTAKTWKRDETIEIQPWPAYTMHGKKTALFAPFIYKMYYFTKTGSGQT